MSGVIKVANVIGSLCKGGVESVVFNYYKFMDKNVIRFDFIIDDNSPCNLPDEIIALGCKVYRIPPYTKLSAYVKALKNIFIQENYKIVHSHMNTLSVFTLYAAKKAGVPVRIAHSHSTAGKGEFKKNLLKYTLRPFSKLYPTHLFACSEYAGRWLFGDKTFNKGKVIIFNNAVDVSEFIYNEEVRNKIRSEFGLNNKFVVGHIGRFTAQKNHSFLVNIFKEVHKRNQESVLLLVGDGELRTQTYEKIKALNLQDYVIFAGLRDDVNEIYQAMDVFVLPSLYEGLPVVGVEAQMSGLYCVFSDAMTSEAKLLDSTLFMNIFNDSADEWAECILSEQSYKRSDVSGQANIKKYDINDEAKKLEMKYIEILPGK
jgi:glycosyltransferase EpsF